MSQGQTSSTKLWILWLKLEIGYPAGRSNTTPATGPESAKLASEVSEGRVVRPKRKTKKRRRESRIGISWSGFCNGRGMELTYPT
ncbi:uncharacterized protein BDCG_16624 [Blastomyces dermatitidis ER-3]|uniref:Uncharacterized protein n=3 Tax=Blastomyces TaxID=229219 RepID=A0A179UTC5_BLAGS|nr:uncharacterized protein BDBG_17262 [Blastomyces gilchristii SLH14081]XP_045280183.1 uncharacterized protein BDCG_16624 [Blastomyces dermatitidis ER-3]KMW66553.1 hypothetical protein BDDG_11586 [Blastomyces dermatitidis ATCC 18188]OAT00456.1 hypothetical protein BDCG_16624 [Blastomyces dermatitidis ER-3]OAT09662.1 hypothetical protein BDBG_17262 [Blastomyces gilchristii SLH14081]